MSAAARTLQLFTEEMTLERALAIAARFPVRATLRSGKFYRTKAGRRFGPYRAWFAYWRAKKATVHRYVGDDRKKREVELAHALLQRLLDEAAAAVAKLPEVAKLRELQRLAGAKEDDDCVAVVAVIGAVK
jgi:hypothetical protein